MALAAACLISATTVAGPASAQAVVPEPRPEEWWFTTWQVKEKVWPITKGAGVTVAVADSGANATLPEFSGVLLPGADARGQGEDGHRDVDLQPDKYGNGGWGHGTAMTSLIAAQGGGSGMVGLAPQVRILPIIARDNEEYATAIRLAADRGAEVVNVSAGMHNAFGPGRCSPAFQQAIDHALRKDTVVIAASGNDAAVSLPTMPGGCPGVLTVGAVDHNLRPWRESTRQTSVDLAAPGVNMGMLDRDGRLVRADGTSGATALTSAVVALIRSKYPQMSAREVVQRVIATAKDVGPAGLDDQTGYGVVNPHRALTADVPENAPNPVFAEWDRQQRQPPTSAPSTAAARPTSDSDTSSITDLRTLMILVGGAAVLLLAGAGVLLFLRRGRSLGR